MAGLLGFALILFALTTLLFLLALFEAAAITVRQRETALYLLPPATPDADDNDRDADLRLAA